LGVQEVKKKKWKVLSVCLGSIGRSRGGIKMSDLEFLQNMKKVGEMHSDRVGVKIS